MFKVLITICVLPFIAQSYKSPHFWSNRNSIVHLFEWKWSEIASECENFLQHKGYAGVQISPPNENLIIKNRPWWERYQPVSYLLVTRSGDENSFKDMTTRCNRVGIRIYADAVINHMAPGNGIGTANSSSNASNLYFPAVPYGPSDFNVGCSINDFSNRQNTRNCRLVGLLDLNQGKEYVREKIVQYMNHLIDLGVAGFRIDAATHVWPSDLSNIYSRLKNLNTKYGFLENARPFIYQEVSSMDRDYIPLGTLEEFKYSKSLSNVFQGNDKLKWLVNWGPAWGLIDGLDAVAFIDNHDTQRDSSGTLTYKNAKRYKMAVAFMLAHPYGLTRIMSSYDFQDFNQGPPSSSPVDTSCTKGWVCEHRWREIYNMIELRNVAFGSGIDSWWTNDDQQISFCRGNKAFVAFTNWGDIHTDLQTCLPPGTYCDVISGSLFKGNCTGKSVTVGSNGTAFIDLGAMEFNGVLAIHAKSKKD